MDLMMTQLLHEMLQGFPMLVDDKGFSTLDAPSQPYSLPQDNPPHHGSLRDQMLKPGKEELLDKHGWQNPPSSKLNTDIDKAIEKNNIQLLLPQPRNDGLHYSFRFFFLFCSIQKFVLINFLFFLLLGHHPQILLGKQMACLLPNQQDKTEKAVSVR